ncbi:MAG: radical SAM protein [Candidatus Brocadiia bacterium]
MKSSVRKKYLLDFPRLAWSILVEGRYDYTFDLMPMHVRKMSFRKRLNVMASGLNLLWRRSDPWSWPLRMQVELTNVCNLRCPVCPAGRGEFERERGMMDLTLFENLMREVGSYLLDVFLWAWGEPLLHPEFGRAVEIAHQYGVNTVISTNGMKLYEPEVRDQLLENPPLHLIVALDGLTDQTNSVYRVGADVEKILTGVQELAEARHEAGQERPYLHMRYIVMKHNQHELPELEAFARENAFDFLALRTLSPVENAEKVHKNMVPEGTDYDPFGYEDGGQEPGNDFICQKPFIFPTMLVDGTVVSCCQDVKASEPYGQFGSGTSFRKIWKGGRARRVRRTIRDRVEEVSFCRSCPYAGRSENTCSVSITRL